MGIVGPKSMLDLRVIGDLRGGGVSDFDFLDFAQAKF